MYFLYDANEPYAIIIGRYSWSVDTTFMPVFHDGLEKARHHCTGLFIRSGNALMDVSPSCHAGMVLM